MMYMEDYIQKNIQISKKHAAEVFETAKDYQYIYTTRAGKNVLEDLIKKFNHESCYFPGANLNDATYYEGQRSVINYINNQLKYNPTPNARTS